MASNTLQELHQNRRAIELENMQLRADSAKLIKVAEEMDRQAEALRAKARANNEKINNNTKRYVKYGEKIQELTGQKPVVS